MLINVKMPIEISIFSAFCFSFMLSSDEHGNSFITERDRLALLISYLETYNFIDIVRVMLVLSCQPRVTVT